MSYASLREALLTISTMYPDGPLAADMAAEAIKADDENSEAGEISRLRAKSRTYALALLEIAETMVDCRGCMAHVDIAEKAMKEAVANR